MSMMMGYCLLWMMVVLVMLMVEEVMTMVHKGMMMILVRLLMVGLTLRISLFALTLLHITKQSVIPQHIITNYWIGYNIKMLCDTSMKEN
jgi:hypothetical protein